MLLSPVRESTRVIILQHDRPGPAQPPVSPRATQG